MADLIARDGLVLDTSVWINLFATEAEKLIVATLGVKCYAPKPVVAEVKRNPVTGKSFAADDHPLSYMEPHVSVTSLKDKELDIFLQLVSAAALDGIGDGEASAIAIADQRGLDLVVDDIKARRIVKEKFREIRLLWTVDLLRASQLTAMLGDEQVNEYIYKARKYGRMHVPKK